MKCLPIEPFFVWGHDLIFSFILKQQNYRPIINKLNQLKESPDWKNVQLSTAPAPWEWDKDSKNFVSVAESSEENIRKIIDSVQYIKLCRFYSLKDADFHQLNWTQTGLANWKLLSKVYFC